MNTEDITVGFIGAGKMAQAIGLSLINSGTLQASQIVVSAPSKKNVDSWNKENIGFTSLNAEIVRNCDIVFFAMKPQHLEDVIDSLKPVATPKAKVFVSMLAGIKISSLKEKIENTLCWDGIEIIRIMPNTPIAVGAGCTVLCHNENADSAIIEMVKRLMSTGGTCEVIGESLFNSVSAVSGSGPAYMYMVIEALSDGAVKQGCPRDLAIRLAAQTMLGASTMVLKTKKHPGELKDDVCSPGGTTITAVHALEKASVRSAFIDAVDAATKRVNEISMTIK